MTPDEFEEMKSFAAAALRLNLALAACAGGPREVEAYLDEQDSRTVYIYVDAAADWACASFRMARAVTQDEFQRDHRDSIEGAFRLARSGEQQ